MTQRIKLDDGIVDEASQLMLSYMSNSGGSALTSELREAADLDNSHQIAYRFENHLGPDNLGFLVRTEKLEHHGREEWGYSLTNDGLDFVEAREAELTKAVHAAKVVESFGDMREQMSEWDTEIQSIKDTHADMNDEIESKKRAFRRWKKETQKVRNRVEDVEDWAERAATQEQIETLTNDVQSIEKDEETLQNRQEDLGEVVVSMQERIETLEHETEQNRGRTETLRRYVNKLINAVEDVPFWGVLDGSKVEFAD